MEPHKSGFSLRSLFLKDEPDKVALAATKSTNEQQLLAGQATKLAIELITLLRSAPDIGQWRTALVIAESKTNPDRRLLYQVYREVEIDSHVISVTQRLRLRCTNNPIVWRPTTKGQPTPPAIQAIIDSPWFSDMVEGIIESKWWGHSLIQLNFLTAGYDPDTQPGIELISRPNVRPEFGDILPAPGNTSGAIAYRQRPYTDFLLEVGKPNDLGIFNGIAPNVLFKRYAVKDWAEFLEVYGMPLRMAEYDPNQPGQRSELESIMRTMGSNAGVIVPKGSSMQLIDSAKAGNSSAFDLNAAFHNAEISKAILLQTMTTSAGSSLSQAEVHQAAEDEAVMGYRRYVLRYLNSTFRRILQRHGISAEGAFHYDNRERLSMSQMADVLVKLQNIADIPMSWVYETFGIPAPGPDDVIKSNTPVSSQQPDIASTAEKKKLTLPDYGPAQPHLQLSLSEGAITGLEEELLRRIYTDQLATGRIDRTYFFALARQLDDAISSGLLAADWSSSQPSDYRTLLEANVQRFSAAKTLALVQQLNEAKNTATTFAAFRATVAPLLSQYNASWLRTEYNHALATAQMGAAWRAAYAARATSPYWQYSTVGDDRVRPAHARLDGLTFRLDDPEAARLWPPNDFGCRCDGVILNQSAKTPATLQDGISALGPDTWARIQSRGWDTNFGSAGLIFTRSMEYLASFSPNALTPSAWGLAPASQRRLAALPRAGTGSIPAAGLTDHRAVTVPLEAGLALPAGIPARAITDTFSAPHEVWLQEAAGHILRIYLRFYQGGAVVITSSVSPSAPERIISITFSSAPEGLRAGILSTIND